jgi:hypothetical protein
MILVVPLVVECLEYLECLVFPEWGEPVVAHSMLRYGEW